jgi:GT2 family glycosyltransferase
MGKSDLIEAIEPVSRPDRADVAPVSCAVVICAYTAERWDDTMAAITSVLTQSAPPAEVVVVVDHSPALFERLSASDLPVRVVENADTPGLSGARNTGVAAVGADVVAFLDDDAAAMSTWLEELLAPYDDPRVFATGGSVQPAWDSPRRQFPAEFNWVVGCTYRGMPQRRAEVRNVIGANMSFRRDAVTAAGGFLAALGRTSDVPAGCEETELCIRIRRSTPNGIVVYEPRALVRHHVPADRAGWRYFIRRCFAEGSSKAVLSRLEGRGAALATERTYVSRTLPRGVLAGLSDACRGDLAGVGRAARIILGLVSTVAGFVGRSVANRIGGLHA